MQVSCQWRDLKNWNFFGYGHDTDRSPENDDLALFCLACPQPWINLPENWRDGPDQWVLLFCKHSIWWIIFRWLYCRNIVVNGNFSAEHMKMQNPGNDISLSNGKGYMVEWSDYSKHLNITLPTKEVMNNLFIVIINKILIFYISRRHVPIIRQLIKPI